MTNQYGAHSPSDLLLATGDATGETIQIAASRTAKFSAAAALKKQLNR